jgi:hypothetical protein
MMDPRSENPDLGQAPKIYGFGGAGWIGIAIGMGAASFSEAGGVVAASDSLRDVFWRDCGGFYQRGLG